MFQNLYSPSTPNPAYCFSEEVTNAGVPSRHTKTAHVLCIPLHCRGRAGEYRFSALSGPKCSKNCTPPRPRPSEEVTNAGFLPAIQKQHMFYAFPCIAWGARGGVQVFSTFRPQMFQNLYGPASPAQHSQPCLLLLRRSNECSSFPPYKNSTCSMHSPALLGARAGSTGFQHFQAPNVPKPVRPRVPGPAPPQPCLLLLRRSNECRIPSRRTKTAHVLYSPALPGARGGVQVFSIFKPQMFQNEPRNR